MNRGQRTTGLTAALPLFIMAAAARAETEPSYPHVTLEVPIEIQGDFAVDADDPAAEVHDVFTTTEPYLTLAVTRELSAHMHWVLEPVTDPEPDEDRVFGDHGIFLEDLFLNFESDGVRVYGGKFTPHFGAAYDAAPGIYGVDFAEDYEFTERIGLGGAYTFDGGELGEHSLSASVFFLDTVLNHSIGNSRGTLGLSDGGASNTERLNSFALGLDGEISIVSGLGYHLAYIDQAEGLGGERNERGLAGGLLGAFDLGDDWGVNALFEVAHFNNADTVADQERTFVTGGIEVTYRGWGLSFSRTERLLDPPDGADEVNDHLTTVSLGYEFNFGLGVNFGWKRETVDDADTDFVGFLLTYALEAGPYPN